MNILIEGMTSEGLEEFLKNEWNDDNNRVKELILNRNQMGYITKFFSDPLFDNGKYKKECKLSDLFTLYYLDHKFKQIIKKYVDNFERILNVTMLNTGIKTGDKENTLNKKIIKLKDSKIEKQNAFLLKYNYINSTNFKSIEVFLKSAEAVRFLRNFALHHYAVLSYKYATMIDNGNEHQRKSGEERNLKFDFDCLYEVLPPRSKNRIIERINKHLDRYEFTNKNIEQGVYDAYLEILKFNRKKVDEKDDPKTIQQFVTIK